MCVLYACRYHSADYSPLRNSAAVEPSIISNHFLASSSVPDDGLKQSLESLLTDLNKGKEFKERIVYGNAFSELLIPGRLSGLVVGTSKKKLAAVEPRAGPATLSKPTKSAAPVSPHRAEKRPDASSRLLQSPTKKARLFADSRSNSTLAEPTLARQVWC